MFHYFLRGALIYWHTDRDIVDSAHKSAISASFRGFDHPGPVCSTDMHPSRVSVSNWRLHNGNNCMG